MSGRRRRFLWDMGTTRMPLDEREVGDLGDDDDRIAERDAEDMLRRLGVVGEGDREGIANERFETYSGRGEDNEEEGSPTQRDVDLELEGIATSYKSTGDSSSAASSSSSSSSSSSYSTPPRGAYYDAILEDLRRTTEAAAIAAARSALALPPAGVGVPTLSQHWRDRRRLQRGLSPLHHHSPIYTSPLTTRSSLLIDRSPPSRQQQDSDPSDLPSVLSSSSSPATPSHRRFSESVERQRRYNLTRTSPILSLSDDDPTNGYGEQIESQWPRGLTPPSPRPAAEIEREITEGGDFQDDWGATNDILPEYMMWRMPPSMDERGGRRTSRSGSRNATVMKWRWNKYKRDRG